MKNYACKRKEQGSGFEEGKRKKEKKKKKNLPFPHNPRNTCHAQSIFIHMYLYIFYVDLKKKRLVVVGQHFKTMIKSY